MKVGIVGAGLVGAAAGYLMTTIAAVSELVLIDRDEGRARGEAADIAHAAAFGAPVIVRAGGYRDLAGAALVVVTAGVSLKPGETRLELTRKNVAIAAEIIPRVLDAAPDAVLLFATNPVDVLPAIAVRRFGVSPERAIGTGAALDSARFRTRLAEHLGIAAQSVHAYVVGEHGDSEVLHWSGATVGGMGLLAWAEAAGRPIDAAARARIAEDVRTSAYRIKEGKGVSNFGIGACIVRLAGALLQDDRTIHCVSTYSGPVEGVAESCVSLPHVLGRGGAERAPCPPIDAAESAALADSARIIADAIRAAEEGLS